MRILEGEHRIEAEEMFQTIMTKNVLKLMLDNKGQIQEVQRIPVRINVKEKLDLGIAYSNCKKSKIKKKRRKETRGEKTTYGEVKTRITLDFSLKTM